MPDYTLYYWPIPFRGQFVRAVLAHAGADWDEADAGAVARQRAASPADQLVPHMGPPLLVDHRAGVALSQMPAILHYLGDRHALLPSGAGAAMTLKIVADANDVLYEMTRHNGDQMWTEAAWRDFQPRLERWMTIFEATGRAHGLGARAGFLLGTDAPGIADLVTATLWGTMTDSFPALLPMLGATAPRIAALTARMGALPCQTALRGKSRVRYGQVWCGGQIEASLRTVLEARDG